MHRLSIIIATGVLLLALGACGDAPPDPDSEAYRTAVAAFYTGLAAIESGADSRGEEKLKEVTDLAPQEAAAWINLGLLALRQNEYVLANERLLKAQAAFPENSTVALFLGLLESNQGNSEAAVVHFRQAAALDSSNVKALYAFALEIERQSGPTAEVQELLEEILRQQPENLAVLLKQGRVAAQLGDAASVQDMVTHLGTFSDRWPEEAREQWQALADAVADPQAVAARVAFLQNVLLRVPAYQQGLAAVQTPVEQVGDLVTQFLWLPMPQARVAPPDDSLTFIGQTLVTESGPWESLSIMSIAGETGGPTIGGVNASEVEMLGGATLPLAGTAETPHRSTHSVAELDFNYDFTMDLVVIGADGFRLFKQDTVGVHADVTAQLGLAESVTQEAYTGVWAADLDLEGDVDLILGAVEGPPVVLRNNGDETFAVVDVFSEIAEVRAFAWADFDADGDPDAAMLDASGTLHLFANERASQFTKLPEPSDVGQGLALDVADMNSDAVIDLVVFQADGTIARLSGEDGLPWHQEELARWSGMTGAQSIDDARVFAFDFDNNGGIDVLASTSDGGRIWLNGTDGTYGLLRRTIEEQVFAVADLSGDGHLDLIGLSEEGQPVQLENVGFKPYNWKQILPRAAATLGDQRINSFGIGGEVEIRSGLLFQKQVIKSPMVHFGMGEDLVADVARIIWPNGSVQAEFDLLSGQVVSAQQRLKGSCPWLFTYNGEEMQFVTDFIWRSPLGLKINAQETAGVMTTEDWVKIRGDQLVPRDGYYDLRITAELWETHFFDHVSLMVVDHPEDTEVYVDERFAFPPPELQVYATGHAKPIQQAWDDFGTDVTDLVHARDERYLDTFGRGDYQGVTRDHFVEIELGADVPQEGPLWLLASGWIRPTDSSINVALGQGQKEPPQGLRLEVQDAQGNWVVVNPNLGFPAGKAKTVLVDLEDVFEPGASRRLRLGTNLEIYWDAFSWAEGQPSTTLTINRLQPEVADLHYRGFSVVHEADRSSPELPVYQELASTSQVWRDLVGYYTRFGDVKELLEDVDDRYVIMNAGDEMTFRFPAPPAPPQGWTRDFVLIGDGWVKDGDYNTSFSTTVLPLPSHDDPHYSTPPTRLEDDPIYQRHSDDWQRYHTRYVTPRRFQHAMRSE